METRNSRVVVHVYNPSHDEALAVDRVAYCPSSAARRTGARWWDVARHWAAPDDYILRLPDDGSVGAARFCSVGSGSEYFAAQFDWSRVNEIAPWGWDRHIAGVLRKLGAPDRLIPSDSQLAALRQLSSRHTAVRVLDALYSSGDAALPESIVRARSEWCVSEGEVNIAIENFGGRAMLKQPWSCSGRGVWRSDSLSSANRVRKTLREQGAVEVEPLYDRMADFAMEFFADQSGCVRYEGLSIFETHEGGGYAGNVVAPQEELAAHLASRVDYPLPLAPLAERLCSVLRTVLGGAYTGPLGVDMMLTPQGVHPCIEVNVRNTMGRVAIFEQRSTEIV